MLSSSSSQVVGTQVPLALFDEVEPQGSYHLLSNLEGVLAEKSYVSVSQMRDGRRAAQRVLFLRSSGAPAGGCPGRILLQLLPLGLSDAAVCQHRRGSADAQYDSAAAKNNLAMRGQRFGGGDLAVRVGGGHRQSRESQTWPYLYTMAENIQTDRQHSAGSS